MYPRHFSFQKYNVPPRQHEATHITKVSPSAHQGSNFKDMLVKAGLSAAIGYGLSKAVLNDGKNVQIFGQIFTQPSSMAVSSGLGSMVADVTFDKLLPMWGFNSPKTSKWVSPLIGAAASGAVLLVGNSSLLLNGDNFMKFGYKSLLVGAASEVGGDMAHNYTKTMFGY
jgi:hypothetical protein